MVRARKRPPDGRVNSGGARQGTPGTAYQNRTDLNAAPSQPVRVATGQAYGQATAQTQAQQAIPLPQQASPPPPDAHAAAAAFQMPAFGPFDRPTERPDEPLTHGAPVGPGAGPEILPGLGGAPSGMSALLRTIAGAVGSTDLDELAQRAEALGH